MAAGIRSYSRNIRTLVGVTRVRPVDCVETVERLGRGAAPMLDHPALVVVNSVNSDQPDAGHGARVGLPAGIPAWRSTGPATL